MQPQPSEQRGNANLLYPNGWDLFVQPWTTAQKQCLAEVLTEISTSELATDLNFLHFKIGRDHCAGDAYSGLESQCLQSSHPSSCCCVTFLKTFWGKSCAFEFGTPHMMCQGKASCWWKCSWDVLTLRALPVLTKNLLGCLLVPAPAPLSCLTGSSFVC